MRERPLTSLKVVGMGRAPFCGVLLGDRGADVIRIDRPEGPPARKVDVTSRSRQAIATHLKHPDASSVCLALVERGAVVIASSRPGVIERLALGPEPCLDRNPAHDAGNSGRHPVAMIPKFVPSNGVRGGRAIYQSANAQRGGGTQ